MNALARLGWIICLAIGISTAIVFSDGLIPLFIKAGVLAFAVSLIGMSALLVVVEYRREEEDRKHQRTIELARLPRRAEPQAANPASARSVPDDGGETPTPEFLDTLFNWLVDGKTDKLPTVRDGVFRKLDYKPNRIQAMLARLASWGAVVERQERGASGRMVWDIVQCRRYMIAERPDYAPTLTASGDIKNTHAV